MLLCEGYMDVIALHAAGFEFAVATLGTAMTPEHARMFSKYTKKVIISYDSDEAGQNAANKAMRLLGEVGVDVRVLKMAGAKDPDEYIKKFGPDRFRKLLEESRTGFEYKSEAVLAKYDLTDGTQKIKASNELCAIVASYWSSVEREVYLDVLSKKLELPHDVLRNSVEQIRRRNARQNRAEESREAQASVKNFGDRINPQSSKDVRATAAEETVLGLLLIYEDQRNEIQTGRIPFSEEDFVTDFNRRVFSEIMKMHATENGFHFELLGENFSPDEIGRIKKMEVARQQLTQNGVDVLKSSIQTLRDAKNKATMKNSDLTERLAFLREKNAKLHKGKADTQ
jgi:DNA primase